MNVAVVGAGASGLFVSGFLSKKNIDVTLFDKNEKAGKKIYITGSGRCNLTNLCSPEDFLTQVVRGQKFLKTAIYSFSSYDCVDYFENLGLKTKCERGNRVFPESDKSSDVIKYLQKFHCKDVNFKFNEEVLDIRKENDKFNIITSKNHYNFDRVIIATGGKSYQATGSNGAGYKFAKKFNHKIVPIVPALCPILIKDNFVSSLKGVSLKNVTLKVSGDKKSEFFGEMIFTDKGISGPIVLSASSFINRCDNVNLSIDFKPALNEQQLDCRLLREFEQNKNKELKNVLKNLLPKAIAEIFGNVVGIDSLKKCNSITKEERLSLIKFLKNFPISFAGLYDIDSAIVTSGGVDLSEINPKTFESKIVKGLYFLGEVLDVDALTGGFNLQIAWSSAFCCAKNWE